jgi:predicted transcriptional regulator
MYAKMCLQSDEAVVHPFASISSVEKELIEKTFMVVKDDTGKFYGIVTPSDVLVMGHQLVIDCLRPKAAIDEDDQIEKVLMIMNEKREYVLPVFNKKNVYIGSTTYARVIEEVGLLKRQPTQIQISNVIGSYDAEMVKQAFIHELYHNIKNPLQIIYSSVNLYKTASTGLERDNLMESIVESTKQVDETVSELFFSYFKMRR